VRVEIYDFRNYRHEIDTADPALAGKWAAEKFRLLMSANASIGDCRLRIWPSDLAESKTIGQHDVMITQDNLLSLAGDFIDAAGKLGAIEASKGRI
jgi:hypothetical protein